MFRAITNTVFTRFLIAFVNFIVVVGTARYLGAEIRGIVSLIGVSTSILHVLNNLVGGSSLVYLTPRNNVKKLITISYIWSFIACSIGTYILVFLKVVPEGFETDVLLLGLLLCLSSINQHILLAQKKITSYNVSAVLQSLVLISVFLFFVFVKQQSNIYSFINALYASYSICFAITIAAGIKTTITSNESSLKTLISDLFKHGFTIQLSSLLQLINYRFSYYLLEKFHGNKALGLFSVTIAVSEAVWIISRSMATIQYSYISNSNDKNEHIRTSIMLAKFSAILTFSILLVMILLPENFYQYVLGKEFSNTSYHLLLLSPGILFHAITTILAHYFSGNANFKINTVASGIAALVAIIIYPLLIPKTGITGACIASNMVYLSGFIYTLYSFHKQSNVTISVWLPNKADLEMLKKLKQLIGLNRN
jgi:O-antigen/teichoic acid export membrane protein